MEIGQATFNQITYGIAILIVQLVFLGILSYIIRKWLGEVEERMSREIAKVSTRTDAVVSNHHTCREELPKVYGSKSEQDKLWARVDDLFERLVKIETMREITAG